MDEVLFSTAYQARKERVAGLIKKFVQWKSAPSSRKVKKEGNILCVQIPKCIPKILPPISLNNVKVSICTTYFSVTYPGC